MKRWQDRGEVQDSDDEDINLSSESQSPARARKRARLDDVVRAPGVRAEDDGDEETEEVWLQPRIATTYSRKVRAIRVNSPVNDESQRSQPGSRNAGSDAVLVVDTTEVGREGGVNAEQIDPSRPSIAEDGGQDTSKGQTDGESNSRLEVTPAKPSIAVICESQTRSVQKPSSVTRRGDMERQRQATTTSQASSSASAHAEKNGPLARQGLPLASDGQLGKRHVDDHHDEELDDAWLLPSTATTYTRKLKAVEINLPKLTRPLSPDLIGNLRNFALENISRQNPPDVSATSGQGSSRLHISEDGPTIRELLSRRTSFTDDQHLEQDDSSGLSSPLSERDLSPPPEFRLPRFSTVVANPEVVPRSPEQGISLSDDEILAANILQTNMIGTAGLRRQLRARQEKQLHPYAHEKTLYQQQWRQRGLRPVHFTTRIDPAPETQDQAYSTDYSQNQERVAVSLSSPARASSELGTDSLTRIDTSRGAEIETPDSDQELPDIDAVLGRTFAGGIQDGRKRRKVAHLPRVRRFKALNTQGQPLQSDDPSPDDFTVPPSPPPTSSDSARGTGRTPASSSLRLPSGFRMPFGMTPAALPTPDVSSVARQSHQEGANPHSESESPLPTSRTPVVSHLSRSQHVIDSATESEADEEPELEPTPEADDRRLRKEKRRIKGVLPASWLKIDFRAQQRGPSASPFRTRRLGTASPPPTVPPQRGVAQRVSRTSTTPARRNIIDISDASDDSDSAPSPLSSRAIRQPQSGVSRSRPDIPRDETVDIDRMENDWVDPMTDGVSRAAQSRKKPKKRQLRIKEVFNNVRRQQQDFSEEHAGLRQKPGPIKSNTLPNASRVRQPRRQQQPRPPALSILDAPLSPTHSTALTPQFIRLAKRQAKRQTGRGRHSPSHKAIRLATIHETDDASITLQLWREGMIVPSMGAGAVPTSTLALSNDNASSHHQVTPSRTPEWSSINNSSSHQRIIVQQPRLRQARLQPESLHRQPGLEDSDRLLRSEKAASENTQVGLGPVRRRSRTDVQTSRLRGAQLESLESAFDQEHRTAAFERRVNYLTETAAARGRATADLTIPLQRFLVSGHGPKAARASTHGAAPQESEQTTSALQVQNRNNVLHRPRKRQPRRVDAEARQYRQPSEPLPDIFAVDTSDEVGMTTSTGPILQGLGPFGTKYSMDFDVQPLALGTYFHESTFIGSGEFAASLVTNSRDLNVMTGRIRVHVNQEVLEWGVWTEEVAAGVARIPCVISEAILTFDDAAAELQRNEELVVLTSNIDHMLRSIVRYCSRCLAFTDPIDRRSCIQHFQRFLENLLEVLVVQPKDNDQRRKLQTRCSQYALVIARQVYQLSDHVLVEPNSKLRSQQIVSSAGQRLGKHLLPTSLAELRSFYEDNRYTSKREAGIREDDGVVSGLVILSNCLGEAVSYSSFWYVTIKALDVNASNLGSVRALDKVWYDIFTLLPVLEMDPRGMARPGSRMSGTLQDWSLMKTLTSRVLELYPASSIVNGTTVNDYLRATFIRCFRLVTRWGWWQCDSILGTVYDSYSRRGLGQLHNEDSRGSPRFLEELANHPSFEAQPEDRSFHIFLKLLAIGLQGMQKPGGYSDKKVSSILWRFVPNHGRTCRKDTEVMQTDLDALRNHHDLLCTLYYASPSSYRLRLDLLRNLVDHSTSHREACRLSVRAWANLAAFQASTAEPDSALQPLVEWYREILLMTMTQYRLARTEAEHDYAIAKAQGATGLTESMLTATIANNQRQIAATIVDALVGLKRALRAAKTLPTAISLIEGSMFWTIFTPFDVTERRLFGALDEALEVIIAVLEAQRRLAASPESQQTSEESQDYGDASAFEDIVSTHQDGFPSNVSSLLLEPMGQLLSNVFGADQSLDDVTLTKLVDVWVQLARESVRNGRRSWSNYLDDYSANSWRQLRDTEQRRRYTSHFLADVVSAIGEDWEDVKFALLGSWLVSLVEREAMLKFQHVLTTALLNSVPNELLLDNPPFSRDDRTGTFNISLLELRQRRLALISSVLSNMRAHYDETLYSRPKGLYGLRRTYSELLKLVMQAMKTNYQELQTSISPSTADPNTQGAYVEFVQHVVSYLQQHTTDICRVDPFFTDSSAFPLPAGDPAYVVGRLKAYVPKLAESKTRKQLAVFIHTVSERAAVDGQQQYLVDQLCAAIHGVFENGDVRAPSLRHVMLTAIIPAYLGAALATACSWILALPILQACEQVVGDLLYTVKLENEASVIAVVETIGAVLSSLQKPLSSALMHPGLLRLPHIQRVLALVFGIGRAMLTVSNWIRRSTAQGRDVIDSLNNLYTRAKSVLQHLDNSYDDFYNDTPYGNDLQVSLWADTQAFASKQVQDAFETGWRAHDGQYFVRRGNGWKEVVVALGDEEEEQARLMTAAQGFCGSFEVVLGGRGREGGGRALDGWGVAGVVV